MKTLALFLAAAPLFGYSAPDGQAFLKTYCAACHAGKLLAGDITSDRWTRIALRVRNSEMPPRNAPSPALNDRKAFINWVEDTLHNEACAAGPVAGHSPIRRLNRDEYTATVRELLNIHLNVGHDLPADGAGGQGFDNAAEVLVLSPVLVEKYMDAAKTSLEYAVKDSRARARIGIIPPDRNTKPDQAARNILIGFLPRAFRRPVSDKELEPFLGLFREAQKRRQTFDASVVYMLRGVLMSPQFLFHSEMPNTGSAAKQLDDYALASRLSYFLWDSMPDEMLFDLAAAGKLHEPSVLKEVVARMLRSGKAMNFVESFVTQWLGTRELGREFVPDPKVFPKYSTDADLQGDIRFQPIVFFQSMVANNDPVTDLLDSKWTIGTKKLLDLYGVDKKYLRKDNQSQPHRLQLPPGTDRGGLLGMSAVLAVSSYPYRTSPVLRGKWVLDSILGTPPLPPPPNVPALEDHPTGAQPKTIRERLAQHRRDPVCASCHSSIDPIGFALENYDALGQFRSEDAGKPVDSSGELPDGTKFQGALELKAVLLQQKDLFVRNLTNRMLGYALGRGLTRQDGCTVDSVIAQLKANDYKSQSLIEAIVMSPVFQLQKGTQFQKDSQFQKGTQ